LLTDLRQGLRKAAGFALSNERFGLQDFFEDFLADFRGFVALKSKQPFLFLRLQSLFKVWPRAPCIAFAWRQTLHPHFLSPPADVVTFL
jgi:hypothetical protein